MLMRPGFLLLSAALVLLTAPSPQPARADDGGGAADERPLIEYSDRSKRVSIQLPGDWRAVKDRVEIPQLAAWEWPDEKNPKRIVGRIDVHVVRHHARAELARYMGQHGRGEQVSGSQRRGAGFSESCVLSSSQPLALFERYVEKDGVVYLARFVCHKEKRRDNQPFAQRVLETFTVVDPLPMAELDDRWSRSKVKGLEVWTDSDNKALVKETATKASVVWNVMKKALKGKGVLDGAPQVRAYQTGARFTDASRGAFGAERDFAFYDHVQRNLAIKLMSAGQADFDGTLQQAAALHYLGWFFGGDTPVWISRGMMTYGAAGAESGGKPQKPADYRLRRAKRAVSASARRLDEWFKITPTAAGDDQKTFDELWAWHWFFRHGKQGKKYRKTYELCLQTLHKTGDVEAAHAVWEGTDFYGLQADWKRWAAGGKKDDKDDPEDISGQRPNNRPDPDNAGGGR